MGAKNPQARKIPFLANRSGAKSTPVTEIVQELNLQDGNANVPEHLLSPEQQRQINSIAKNVDLPTYVAADDKTPSKIKAQLVPPWEDLSTRRRVKAFNLFPSEALKARMKFLSDETGVSQHEICMEILEKVIIKMSDEAFEKKRRNRG